MTALGVSLILMIIAMVATQLWLYGREINFQNARRDRLQQRSVEPLTFAQQQTEVDFTIANMRLAACAAATDGLILAVMTLGGGLSFIHAHWIGAVSTGVSAQVLTVVTIVVICAGVHRLLAAYRQFSIFRRFEIGRMSALLFAKDTLTNGGLLVVVAGFLAAICIVGAAEFEAGRWFVIWLIWICFDWGRLWLYSGTLAHMFDRLTNLSDEVLTIRISELMKRSGCVVDNIEVVDSSKRSTHANASVVGIGNTKRVIFHDTLLATLTKAEIVAVMAHELGHVRNSHVIKEFALRSGVVFVWIVGIGQLLQIPAVQVAFNPPMASDGKLLALLWLLTPIFALIAKPLISTMLRLFEFEADRFVLCHDDPIALKSALRKLYARNASARICDPLYGFVYNSHPSLQDRLDRLCVDGQQIKNTG